MNKALIINGSFLNPNENWYPWLEENLEHKDFEVLIPKFPTPNNQSFDNR